MSIASVDELWSTPLKHRIQSYRSQIHNRSARKDRVGDSDLLLNITKTFEALNIFAAELKVCMNAMSIVSRLSPEILALVFRFLSHELPVTPHHAAYEADFERHEEPSILSTWVKVTHVSKHWREVALGDTSLWTKISTTHSAAWAKVLLSRSGTRTVSLYLGDIVYPDWFHDPVWEEAVSRAHTIQIGDHRTEWQRRLLDLDANSLVAFHIQLRNNDNEDIDDESELACPSRFFKSTSDKFRELEVCGFFSYSFSSLHPALTSLKLGLLSDDQYADVGPVELLLNGLSGLQQLRELTLLGLITENFNEQPVADQYFDSVRLPHLEPLHLKSCLAKTLSTLFSAIAVSANTKVRLIIHHEDWNRTSNSVGEFATVLERCFSTAPWHKLKAVAVFPIGQSSNYLSLTSTYNDKCFAVSAWHTDVDAHGIFFNNERGFVPKREHEPDLYLCLPKKRAAVDDYPLPILRLFGQPSVHTLFLTTNHNLFLAWDSMQMHFPALRHILMRDFIFADVIRSMYKDCHEMSRQRLSFRHQELRRMTVVGKAVYWRGEMAVEDSVEGTIECTLAQLLERVLCIRADNGLPIEVFVDEEDVSRGAFRSMNDVSMLKTFSLPSPQ